MFRFSKTILSLLTVGLSVFSTGFSVQAEAQSSVNHESFGLEYAKEKDGVYTTMTNDFGQRVISRSLAKGDDVPLESGTPSQGEMDEFSDNAQEFLMPYWTIPPELGGATGSKNHIALTKETKEQLDHLNEHITNDISNRDDVWLDMQVVPMYHAQEDVIPTYLFVGYRALESDGTPVSMGTWESENPLVGSTFTGGSEYQYIAIKNGSVNTELDYSTGEPSDSEEHGGFEQGFDPTVYFGEEGSVVNNEQQAQEMDPDDLPPGSSPRFVEQSQEDGIDALNVASEQVNGEVEGSGLMSGFGNLIAGFLPFLLLGAVLLIAGDN